MRIWDIEPCLLCHKHLLGEHRELHGLWNILVNGKKGYSRHPETLRWVGKRAALYKRHTALVAEMKRRGYNHNSPLPRVEATGKANQTEHVNTIEEQEQILKDKPCKCFNKIKPLRFTRED